jgi:hypothetical protein
MTERNYIFEKNESISNVKQILDGFQIPASRGDITRVYDILENYYVIKYLGSVTEENKKRFMPIYFGKTPGSLFDIEKKSIKVFHQIRGRNIKEMTIKEILLCVISEREFDAAVQDYDKKNPDPERDFDDYDDYDNDEILGFDLEVEYLPKKSTMEEVDGGKRKTRSKKRKQKSKKSKRKSKGKTLKTKNK